MTDHVLENWKDFLREEKKENPAGAGFIIFCPDKDSILLIRRAEASDKGELSTPGGSSKGDETPLETAIRETTEEVGKDFTGRSPMEEYEIQQGDFTFTTFLVGSVDEFPCSLNVEHDAWGWVDIDEVNRAIKNKDGVLISNKFYDRSGKEIEVKAKIHKNMIDTLKNFNI
jgi:8-oxo-dGTP pyrophosphatase MutT (NUDIX family)